MALEKKDVRCKLDPAMHAALTVVAEADDKDIGEWCEAVIAAELVRRVRSATLIAKATERLGFSGK